MASSVNRTGLLARRAPTPDRRAIDYVATDLTGLNATGRADDSGR